MCVVVCVCVSLSSVNHPRKRERGGVMGRGVNNQGRNQFSTYSYRSKDTPPAPPSIVPSCSRINRARWLIENRETNEERLPYGTPPCLNFVSTGSRSPFSRDTSYIFIRKSAGYCFRKVTIYEPRTASVISPSRMVVSFLA